MSTISPGQKFHSYTIKKCLNTDASSSVWLAEHTLSSIQVAIKIISKKIIETHEGKTKYNRELSLIKLISHPFIVELFETFDDEQNHFLVLEYLPKGNVSALVKEKGHLNEEEARRIFLQLIHVLEYFHDTLKVCHRILIKEKILLDENENIRVIPLNLSHQILNTQPIAPASNSPEFIKGHPYTKSCDIWAAGILLFYLVSGITPFESVKQENVFQKVLYTEPDIPNHFSSSLADLIKKMLIKNPANRIGVQQIKIHPWFSTMLYLEFRPEQFMVKFDQSIAAQMSKQGFDSKSVFQSVIENGSNEESVLYKIYHREKMVKEFPKNQEQCPPNAFENAVRSKMKNSIPLKKRPFGRTNSLTDQSYLRTTCLKPLPVDRKTHDKTARPIAQSRKHSGIPTIPLGESK